MPDLPFKKDIDAELKRGTQPPIGVVGLWHLGCTIAACWAKLGFVVRAVDVDEDVINALQVGRPPIYEPGLEEAIRSGVAAGNLSFSTSLKRLEGCRFVFVAYDTPVHDDDSSDLGVIENILSRMGPRLDPHAIVIVSAQLPVGTAQTFRSGLKRFHDSIELVYSPENLRLGEALACYSSPGHIVIGADSEAAATAVEELFVPMQAACLKMSLPSAEMTKHAINAFLAASITFANQLADICESVEADFAEVAGAMRHDPRISRQAYLTPGIGFSGGTLGRDLQVLEQVNQAKGQGRSPIFGEIWRYNKARVGVVRERCRVVLGSVRGMTIALLGMTYKPGTSTLRRSLPLEVAEDLNKHGAILRVFDPKANWAEVRLPTGLTIADSPYTAMQGAHMGVFLTEWPDFLTLDFSRLKETVALPNLFDTKGMLRSRYRDLESLGFNVCTIGRASTEGG